MFWAALLIHLTVLVAMARLFEGTRVLSSPSRMLFLANYAYFFVLWSILVDMEYVPLEQQTTYGTSAAFGISFLLGVSIYRFLPDVAAAPTISKTVEWTASLSPTVLIYVPYALYVVMTVAFRIDEYETLNPLEAFSRSYLAEDFALKERGSYVARYAHTATGWILYFLAIGRAIDSSSRWTRYALLAAVVSTFVFVQTYTGTKSAVILPLLYLVFAFAIADRISRSARIAIAATFICTIPLALVFLNLLRAQSDLEASFVESLLFRIDYVPVLTGYFQHERIFASIWPPFWTLLNLIPSQVADLFGIAKPDVSFDVAYTRLGLGNPWQMSSSAGVGVAATMETLKPLGMAWPLLAFVAAGLLAGLFTEFWHRLIAKAGRFGGMAFVAIVVPPLHIIGFFEVGPTLFSNIIIYFVIGYAVVFTLLLFGCVRRIAPRRGP
jgi:hypothetical protein